MVKKSQKGKGRTGATLRILNTKQRYDLTIWYQSQVVDGQAIDTDRDSAVKASAALGFDTSPHSIKMLRKAAGVKIQRKVRSVTARSSQRSRHRQFNRERHRLIQVLHDRLRAVEEYLSATSEFTPHMKRTQGWLAAGDQPLPDLAQIAKDAYAGA